MKLKLLLIALALFGAFGLFFFSEPENTVAENQCRYRDTQARVQNNINVPWQQHITVGCEATFNVGSFHDGTGQFANDTSLEVVGPYPFRAFFQNGQRVQVPYSGRYTLHVTTNGQTGSQCYQAATVIVNCPSLPTGGFSQQPQPTPTSSCNYSSTQARVQTDIEHDWKSSIDIKCGEKFNVGSFHNATGQFANDTSIRVTGPQGLNHTFRNADRLRALYPGTYQVHVTTNNQSGGACEEKATVNVSCPGEWWRN